MVCIIDNDKNNLFVTVGTKSRNCDNSKNSDNGK